MKRLMLALSSRSPNARVLVDTAARLAAELQAEWYVVHVREEPTLHYRRPMTEHPVPEADLAHARKLGARAMVERGELVPALVAFARTMSINYLVSGRSFRPRISFTWRLPLAESVQRKLPGVILMTV